MMRRHCDVCGEQCKRDVGAHFWASSLPVADPLRRVSATIEFHGEGAHRDVDLCDTCMARWLVAVTAIVAEDMQAAADRRRELAWEGEGKKS